MNRSADGHVNGHQSGSSEIRVKRAEQSQIGVAVGGEIEGLRPDELDRAVSRDIRSLPHHVSRSDEDRLLRVREFHGLLIVEFSGFHFDLDRGKRSIQRPATGIAKRSAHRHRSADRRMSGQLVTEVSAPQGVKIEMIHAGCDGRRIVSTDLNDAFEFEGAVREFGISA